MMKRIILALVIIGVLGYLIFMGTNKPQKRKKVFDRSIAYRTTTYRPYDIKFVYEQFSKISKKGFVINDEKLDFVNKKMELENSILVVCSPYFLPNKQETAELLQYVDKGNDVYLSAFTIAPTFLDTLLNLEEEAVFYNQWPPIPYLEDSTTIEWNGSDSISKVFSYPGVGIPFHNDGYFDEADTLDALSYDVEGGYGLVRIPFGEGHVYVQMRPITMTNYFLLHKNNHEYLELILDNIDAKNKKIIWDNFYRRHPMSRPDHDVSKPGNSYFLELIAQHPPLQWAVYTFIFGLVLFLIVNSRRIQKPVPVIQDVKNTSYDFTKALAGLYWLKQDNRKIAEKIVFQLHDFLQTKYRLFPKDFNLENVSKIAQKTGKNDSEIVELLKQIEMLDENEVVDNKWLIRFYKDVHKFSKT